MMPHRQVLTALCILCLVGAAPVSANHPQDNNPVWAKRQQQGPAAVAQVVGVGHPVTAVGMVRAGSEYTVWPALTQAPAIPHLWLAVVRDDQLFDNLGLQPPQRIGQTVQAEYFALCKALINAWETAEADFAASAARNKALTLDAILKDPSPNRGAVIGLEGWVKSIREIDHPPQLAETRGVKVLYETWLALDKDGGRPVCALVTQLPESLKNAIQTRQFGQFVQVHGYFFKLIRYQNDKGPLPVPMLIAPALVVVALPAVAPLLDRELLRIVRHDKTFPDLRGLDAKKVGKAPFSELDAYDEAVLAAARVPLKAFEASAAAKENKELDYGHLMRDPVGNCGKVVTITGILRRVTAKETPRDLRNKGVRLLYEGWINLKDEQTNPVCVIFPELPENLKVGDNLNTKVRFTGYFFKRYPYEVDNKERKTILLIGPTVTVLEPPPTVLESLRDTVGGPLLSAILGLMVGTLLFIVVLSWWFKRGDQAFKKGLHKYEASKFSNEGVGLDSFGAGPSTEGISPGESPLTSNGHAPPPESGEPPRPSV